MNKTIRRSLVVNLTEEEIAVCAKELARVTTQQAEIEEEKKVVASSYKEKLERCISETRSLVRKISTRQDFREVECVWANDYPGRQAILFRLDNWDEIERRKLTTDEIQLSLLEEDAQADQELAPGRPENAPMVEVDGCGRGRKTCPADGSTCPDCLDPPEEVEHYDALAQESQQENAEEAAICLHADCDHHDKSQPNGCAQLEYVEECDRFAVAETLGAHLAEAQEGRRQ